LGTSPKPSALVLARHRQDQYLQMLCVLFAFGTFAPSVPGGKAMKSECGRRRFRLGSVVLGFVVSAATVFAQPFGDVNCDGVVNDEDVSALIAELYADPGSACVTADVNGDGSDEGADVVALMQALDPPPVSRGPVSTFLGLAGVDGSTANPLGQIDGVPVYFRNAGFGFKLIIEAAAGLSELPPGVTTFDIVPGDPTHRPDVQVEVSRALGDGSLAVCEGGVPAVNPFNFDPTQAIADALNDIGCNFSSATASRVACTEDSFGDPTFVNPATQVQFCLSVERALSFPDGDTIVGVRLRDTAGTLGPLQKLIVRIGSGPAPPTFTRVPTVITPTPTVAATSSATATRTRTSPPATPTPSRTLQSTATPTASAQRSPTHTATATATRTPAGPTAIPTRTATVTPTATRTATRTVTRAMSPSATASPTAPSAIGPVVTFMGIIRPDDTLIAPVDMTVGGIPVYAHATGSGFSVVIEGMPGASHKPLGHLEGNQVVVSTFDPDVTVFPDLEIEVSRPLGNASMTVCDDSGATAGGVPAVDPADFTDAQANINTVNDLACRFVDGVGNYQGRAAADACVLFPSGDFGFVVDSSTVQFCGFISKVLEFAPGDTLTTVRLRDTDGQVGPAAQMIIHIGP